MTPLLVTALATLLSASTPPWCRPAFTAARRDSVAGPSLTGLPGLFQVPAAVSALDESTLLEVNDFRLRTPLAPGAQRSVLVGFGFLPRLTLVGRGSWGLTPNSELRDISASAQLLVVRGGVWMPSVAVGAQDVGGQSQTSHFKARYVTASKTLLDRVRLTAGLGSRGTYSLSGPFGGIEISPCSWGSAIGENDGTHISYGVRLAPMALWGADRRISPTLDLLWRQGQGRVIGVGMRLLPAAPHNARESTSRPSLESPAADTLAATDLSALRDALVHYGLENVRVSRAGDTVAVAYENRVFNRQEWDALGVVFGETARRAKGAHAMRATILRVDLPVMEVVSDIGAFREFLNGALGPEGYARQLVVRYPAADTERGPAANPSRFRLDATVRPRFEPMFLTEISPFEFRASLLPQALLRLGGGLSLTAQRAVALTESSRFPDPIADPNADQLLAHAARVGLPFGWSMPGMVSQVSVGRFGHSDVGGSIESDVVLGDGHFSLGGVAAVLGDHPGQFQRSVAIGSLRYRYAPLDLETTMSVGRFLHGDSGGSLEVARRFGLMEVGFLGQATEFAKIASVRVSIPLLFARDPRPAAVRLRMPGYYDLSLASQVLKRSNEVRTDVAIPLQTGLDVVSAFRDRDRLNAVTLGAEVEALREAALEWVGPQG